MKTSILALFLLAASAVAQTPERALEHYDLGQGALALSGYDPVAYFPEGGGKPLRGRDDLTATHAGVTYRFANREHLERFEASAARFAPAYGGWCAYAMSQGEKVEADPTSFRVYRGRLFVFYDGLFNDTRAKWLEDEPAFMAEADAAWEAISGETPPALTRDTARLNLGAGALALGGYDPVAYFPEGGGAPRKGKASLAVVHDGVAYRFANEANRDRFLADPARYEPAYGGWCAYAIAVDGSFVEVDPESYVIQGDRLFVFYDGLLADTRSSWLEGPDDYLDAAEREWAEILEEDRRP